jgi:hypothetical protein
MSPPGFEPEIPASERPHTYALVRAATGIGRWGDNYRINLKEKVFANFKKTDIF